MAEDATRRTRLANERTYLAWWRTGLGTIGVGLAAGKVLPEITTGPSWPWVVLGTAFVLVAVMLVAFGWWRYRTVEHALVGGEEASAPQAAMAALSAAVLVLAIGSLVLVLVG